MNDHFLVVLKGKPGPLLAEMVFVYDIVRKAVSVRLDGENLKLILGGKESQDIPIPDQDELESFLEFLAGIYRLNAEESQEASEPGIRVFSLEARR